MTSGGQLVNIINGISVKITTALSSYILLLCYLFTSHSSSVHGDVVNIDRVKHVHRAIERLSKSEGQFVVGETAGVE